jgi:hypothetical protein
MEPVALYQMIKGQTIDVLCTPVDTAVNIHSEAVQLTRYYARGRRQKLKQLEDPPLRYRGKVLFADSEWVTSHIYENLIVYLFREIETARQR